MQHVQPRRRSRPRSQTNDKNSIPINLDRQIGILQLRDAPCAVCLLAPYCRAVGESKYCS